MPSTKVTIEEAQNFLNEFDKAFRQFYQNSNEHLKISDGRTNTKGHDFYRQASQDVKAFVNSSGFSSSWIWSLFIDEQLKKPKDKRRYFSDTYIEYFENLIIFYQDNVFVKIDDKGDIIYKVKNLTTEKIDSLKNDLNNKTNKNDSSKEGEDLLDKSNSQEPTKDTTPDKDYAKEQVKDTSTGQKTSKKWIWYSLAFIVVVGAMCSFIYLFNKNIENQKIAENRKNIIETAKSISSERASLLSNLFNEINRELNNDYLNDDKRNLSKSIISRIVSLSERFEPYLYLRNGNIISKPLSKERAELFKYLIYLDLDEVTFREVFSNTDFSYSDFHKMNLSNINISSKGVFISGDYGSEAYVLASLLKRPNLKNSDFTDTDLSNTSLYGDFNGSDFSKAILKDVYFGGCNISNVNFDENEIIAEFYACEINNTNFKNSRLYCSFFKSDLRGSIFDNSNINNYLQYFDKNNLKPTYGFFGNFQYVYSNSEYTFYDVFLSPDDLIYEFRFNIDKFYNYPNVAKSEVLTFNSNFSKFHRGKHNATVSESMRPFVLRDGKELILDDNFDGPWEDGKEQAFIDQWKSEVNEISFYIIITNDNYFNDTEILKQSGIEWNKSGYHQFSYDTINVLADKYRHYYLKNDTYYQHESYVCKPELLKSNYKAASFKNCTFNNVQFSTKISNVSFTGSIFNDTYFHGSELYNSDLTNTKGSIYFDKHSLFDSLRVDKNHIFLRLEIVKDSLLKIKYKLRNKPFTLADHLDSIKKSKTSNYRLNYSLTKKVDKSLERLINLDSISKRIEIIESDNSIFYLRDKKYLKKIKQLDELESMK